MKYQFCYGPSGAGKSRYLQELVLQEAAGELADFAAMTGCGEPGFSNYLYVVPEQYTMQTQKDLVSRAACRGIMNVDVLSFGRLAHRIFEETGEDGRTVLDDVGKSLILRRLAGKYRKDLAVIGSRIDSLGMISEVKSQISEFMQYDLSPEDVEKLSAYAGAKGQGALAARLKDLEVLYRAFLEDGKDRFVTGEETYDILAEAIPKSQLVKNSVVVFDGFTGFTPVQVRVLGAIMRQAKKVIFSITAGEDGGPSFTEIDADTPLEEQDLFYLSRKTMRDIVRLGERLGVPREKDLSLLGSSRRYDNSPELCHLEKSLFRHPVSPWKGVPSRIHLFEASSQEEEVRQVFLSIGRLVREQGLAYRDIGIVAGDLSAYADLVTEAAEREKVPVYLDQNRAVLLNPLTEAIRSALDLAASGLTYETVFRYLRAGLSDLTLTQTDVLENYCIGHGIRGKKKWSEPFSDPEAEPLRRAFLAEISPLLLSGDQSAAARTEALYCYLVQIRAGEKTADLAARFAGEGDAVRELEYEQIYRSVIALLDQIHALLGDEPISAKDYLKLVETGFAEIRLGVLPQKADRVLVGDIERSRMNEVKVLFLVGVNDGSIPKGTDKGGLISDLDREFLRDAGFELAPTPREQMYIQRLYLYMNVTKPSEALWLSFARVARDGSALRPSYLVPVFSNLYPDLVTEVPEEDPPERQLLSEEDGKAYLSGALRRYAEGAYRDEKKAQETFLSVYGTLWNQDPEETGKLTRAAFRTYRPTPLSKETALLLYMRTVSGSVTRLETAAKCALRQFLKYGLHLTERKEYRLEADDTGNVLHDSISEFSGLLRTSGLSWNDFTGEQGDRIADEALKTCASRYGDRLFFDSVRSEAALTRMQRILRRTVHTLQFQVQCGSFAPTWFEAPFGGEETFRFALEDGGELILHGRIDRVDLAGKKGTLYVKIVDYKSGDLSLDPKKIASGLQLQLLLYMEAVLDYLRRKYPDEEVLPGALLYYRFQDPILTGNKAVFALGDSGEDLPSARERAEREITKALRPKGMLNEDEEVLQLLDHTGEADSLVVPLKHKKDGTLAAVTKTFSQESFEELMQGVNRLICQMAQEILDGKIDADPVDLGNGNTACTYCPYRNACGFDQRIPGYRYREN